MHNAEISVPTSVIVEGYQHLARQVMRGVSLVCDGDGQRDLRRLTELSFGSMPRTLASDSRSDDLCARATNQLRRGLVQQALASALLGLARAPFRADLLAVLGRVLVELGGHETARRLFEEVRRLDPSNAIAKLGLDDLLDTTAAADLLANI